MYSKEFGVNEKDVRFGNMLYAGNKFLLCTQSPDKQDRKLTCTATMISLDGKASKPQKSAWCSTKTRMTDPRKSAG